MQGIAWVPLAVMLVLIFLFLVSNGFRELIKFIFKGFGGLLVIGFGALKVGAKGVKIATVYTFQSGRVLKEEAKRRDATKKQTGVSERKKLRR
ncbi:MULTISPECIES: hypothetical protein [Acidithiobacillus]|uniref:Uncharacterized protein n=2 Tax=Acidithiobacillus TaxID=119977 RepID=A0A179BQA9_ACIFR|nr:MULTISPECIES: hypothetical protein [Acidithiobacillus]MEB8474705.1 hypothetical protein [Acidithiobacillus ferriphilus]MEB8488147.1 hypothetical protein [Acidithiobacillus ferriphilus]MEB8488733.1 hypothetical protein [Acidithiobacillus ferriphilus]MEB8492177.1 hypothetical protein [Acidithiobacillus ferriphilus]MEB8513481.1 hypothetical protein [Acidithiobacillus ferriphilus]